MKMNKQFSDALKRDWSIQGFNARPLYLNTAARSGIAMKKSLGFGYTQFLFHYKEGYGEMGYLKNDLIRLWRVIRKKISHNPRYLLLAKKRYEKTFQRHDQFFIKLTSARLARLSDSALCSIFKSAIRAQIDAVGIGHMLEPIGIEIENDLKKRLKKEIADTSQFFRMFSLLIAPTQPSFIAQEEMALRVIRALPKKEQSRALKEHALEFSWIQNSYVGPFRITQKEFECRMHTLGAPWKSLKGERDEAIRTLRLSAGTRRLLDIIDFTALWQDERKRNILRMIRYMGYILKEISGRTGISCDLLSYFGTEDVERLRSLSDMKNFQKDLKERESGVFFIMDDDGERSASGEEHGRLLSQYEVLKQHDQIQTQELHGSCAMTGVVVGRVKICIDLQSIKRVKTGDILVASMTRPEFMPALKRAAGIITDEGGVTCHAAIVARELNIPAVIGTKNATKILKEGMIVEIRAHHGLVNILD